MSYNILPSWREELPLLHPQQISRGTPIIHSTTTTTPIIIRMSAHFANFPTKLFSAAPAREDNRELISLL